VNAPGELPVPVSPSDAWPAISLVVCLTPMSVEVIPTAGADDPAKLPP